MRGTGQGRGMRSVPQRRDDWTCSSCGDHQFARNTRCRRCSAARPQCPGGDPPSSRSEDTTTGHWTCVVCDGRQLACYPKCGRCGMGQPTEEALRIYTERRRKEQQEQQKKKKPRERQSGWTCSGCNSHQPARNNKRCRRCAQRREEQAKVERRQQEEAKEQAEMETIAARTAELDACGWETIRLLFIGAHDQQCTLSRLPMELIVMISKMATSPRHACWALPALNWFRGQARKEPDGVARFSIVTYDPDPCGDKPWPERQDGYRFEYSRERPRSEAFIIYEWHLREAQRQLNEKETVWGRWSEGAFLAHVTYHHSWRSWFEKDRSMRRMPWVLSTP